MSDLRPLLVGMTALVCVCCALAAVGWYTSIPRPPGRWFTVWTYLVAIVGLLTFDWLLSALIARAA